MPNIAPLKVNLDNFVWGAILKKAICKIKQIEFHRNNRKPHSTPTTLSWLRSNFLLSEGACIPRCEVYSYYIDFCNRSHHQPVNAASLGKVISCSAIFNPILNDFERIT